MLANGEALFMGVVLPPFILFNVYPAICMAIKHRRSDAFPYLSTNPTLTAKQSKAKQSTALHNIIEH